MRRRFGLLGVSLTVLACGSSDSGPTSASALRKAEPLKSSCSYKLRTESFSDGTTRVRDEARCLEYPCSAGGKTNVSSSVIGDSIFTSFTEVIEQHDAIGTCDDPTPVTCTVYTDSTTCELCTVKSCCAPTFRCENDPNCQAVVQCLAQCDGDQSCEKECRENGEPTAVANLTEQTECLADHCASACN